MDLGTVIGNKVATAISVNGLLVPANSIEKHLCSFADPALFHSEGFGKYHLSRAGSLTRLKQSSRYFALLTGHQLSSQNLNYDFKQLVIHNHETANLVTSEKAVFQIEDEEFEHDYDCVLFEFTDPVQKGALSKYGWYDLTQEINERILPKPSLVIALGYPGYRNTIDYETPLYSLAPNSVSGRESVSSLNWRLAFDPDPKINFDPEGMSGGPVFGIDIKQLDPEAFFAGIITNASMNKFHFLSRGRIASFIRKLF